MSDYARIYLWFAGVKLVGYVLGCIGLALYYKRSYRTGALAGVVRTVIGMAVGGILFVSAGTLLKHGIGSVPAVATLAVTRVLEWGAVFWLFFGRPFERPIFPMILLAIAWSFALDVLGFFLTSGLIRGVIC